MLAAAGPSAPDPVRDLAGRYDERHAVRPHDGISTAETIVEIVPVDRDAAYVRLRYESYGNHICAVASVFRRDRNALLYRAPQFEAPDCVLRLARQGDAIRFEDDNTCRSSCGVNASLDGLEVPVASRRPITYLSRLRASPQYRGAVAAWRARR